MSTRAKTFDTICGVETVVGYTRIYPGMVGGGPERFVSNGLARVLILVVLRGVKLRVGLGRGVRYYKELRIRVRVRVRVTVRVRVKRLVALVVLLLLVVVMVVVAAMGPTCFYLASTVTHRCCCARPSLAFPWAWPSPATPCMRPSLPHQTLVPLSCCARTNHAAIPEGVVDPCPPAFVEGPEGVP